MLLFVTRVIPTYPCGSDLSSAGLTVMTECKLGKMCDIFSILTVRDFRVYFSQIVMYILLTRQTCLPGPCDPGKRLPSLFIPPQSCFRAEASNITNMKLQEYKFTDHVPSVSL